MVFGILWVFIDFIQNSEVLRFRMKKKQKRHNVHGPILAHANHVDGNVVQLLVGTGLYYNVGLCWVFLFYTILKAPVSTVVTRHIFTNNPSQLFQINLLHTYR